MMICMAWLNDIFSKISDEILDSDEVGLRNFLVVFPGLNGKCLIS